MNFEVDDKFIRDMENKIAWTHLYLRDNVNSNHLNNHLNGKEDIERTERSFVKSKYHLMINHPELLL